MPFVKEWVPVSSECAIKRGNKNRLVQWHEARECFPSGSYRMIKTYVNHLQRHIWPCDWHLIWVRRTTLFACCEFLACCQQLLSVAMFSTLLCGCSPSMLFLCSFSLSFLCFFNSHFHNQHMWLLTVFCMTWDILYHAKGKPLNYYHRSFWCNIGELSPAQQFKLYYVIFCWCCFCLLLVPVSSYKIVATSASVHGGLCKVAWKCHGYVAIKAVTLVRYVRTCSSLLLPSASGDPACFFISWLKSY